MRGTGQTRPGNRRVLANGTRSKTVLTESAGQVPIEVPCDRDGTFASSRNSSAC